jgi:hypothetical protein
VQDPLLELILAHQQDLADARVARAATEERVDPVGAVDRGRLQQLPSIEDRLGVDQRRVLAGRLDLEGQMRCAGRRVRPDPADDRTGDDDRALDERRQRVLVLCQVQDVGEVVLEARDRERRGLDLLRPAGRVGLRDLRMREQALLHDRAHRADCLCSRA